MFDSNRPTYEFLIGPSSSDFGDRLPLQVDILRNYSHLPKTFTYADKVSDVLKKVLEQYEQVGIPTLHRETIRTKIKNILKIFKDLLAKRKTVSNVQRNREVEFARSIRNLFEVVPDGVILLNWQIRFLEDQRTHRIDTLFSILRSNRNPRYENVPNEQNANQILDNIDDPRISRTSSTESLVSHHSDIESDSDYSPSEGELSEFENEINSRAINQIPSEHIQRIVQTNASCRTSEALLNIGIELVGESPRNYSTSKSSLWSQCTKYKENAKNQILQQLRSSDYKVVIQFDCKRFRKLNARHIGHEERIVVLCHTELCDVPLCLSVLNSHSGKECSDAVIKAIEENGLKNRTVGLVSDTEAVNTGRFKGAFILIEKHFKAEFFNLPCRHHIYEIVQRAIWEKLFGKTTGPKTTAEFTPLIQNWENIKQNNIEFDPVDETIFQKSEKLSRMFHEAKRVLQIHVKNSLVRHDYAEVNDLALKFLGIKTKYSFRVPGATNNARWMFKIIYAFKTYLFRRFLDLEQDAEKKLESFCLFMSIVFIKFWNRCTIAVDAAYNDLQFLKELNQYLEIDNSIASAGLNAFKRHLSYLSDELILLSLFSDKVSDEAKDMMTLSIVRTTQVPDRTDNSIQYNGEINEVQNLQLHNFISLRSNFLFSRLEIDGSFLDLAAVDWPNDVSYQNAKKKVVELIVAVNDGSERALRQAELLFNLQKVRSEEALQSTFISSGLRFNV